MSIQKFTVEDLFKKIKQGDRNAFEELYDRFWDKLYASVYKRTQISEVTEEIIQDFFINLWIKREEIEIHTSIESYLYASVRFQVLNYFKKEKIVRNYKNTINKTEPFENETLNQIYVNDLNQIIEEEISLLPNKCQKVFRLSRQQNITIKEIAFKEGISTKTVENHLTKALKILRIKLKDHLYILIILLLS
jgi:RNA polymerase sigma-70 factor (family 1)